jgi:putative endonuclease
MEDMPEISAAMRAAVGRGGERIAALFLASLGYDVRARNIRLGRDEIDIVAFDPADRVMVFAEVKTLSRPDSVYHPSVNATWRKVRKLRRSARAWVREQKYEGGYRIDLVCVQGGKVTDHIRELSWD